MPLSDPVERAVTTSSVVQLVSGLRKFSSNKNLSLSDRLQGARYNSKEGFKEV